MSIESKSEGVKSLAVILQEVCKKHDIKQDDVIGSSRDKNLMAARKEFCARAKTETSASLYDIASAIGRSSYSAIVCLLRGVDCKKNRTKKRVDKKKV